MAKVISISEIRKIATGANLKTSTVHVPEFGGDVQITELTANQRMEFAMRMTDEKGKQRLEGLPSVFLDAAAVGMGLDILEAELLNNMPSVVQNVGSAVLELSGLWKQPETNGADTDPKKAA